MTTSSKPKWGYLSGKTQFHLLTAILFSVCFIGTWCWLEKKYPVKEYSHCVFKDGAYVDMYEYHFLCVNLFAKGKYGVAGFLKPESYYRFCTDDTAGIKMGELYAAIFRKAGPVTITTRPPVYIALVALVYKLFGYDIANAIRLNFFMLSLLVAAMVTGSLLLWGATGIFTGALSAFLFLHFSPFNPYYLLPDITLVVLVMLFFLSFIRIAQKRQLKLYFIAGLMLGLTILTKGILVPVFGLVLLVLVRYENCLIEGVKKAGSLAGGVLLLLIPWMIFINPINQQTKIERDNWKLALDKNYPIVKYTGEPTAELMGENGNKALQTQAFKSLINYFYRYYMETPPFIILTSQLVPDAFLRYHNEYCTDGDIHAEYILFKNTFYNRIDERLPAWKKIFLFYKTNPSLFPKIAIAKLQLAFLSRPFPVIVWSVILCSLTILLNGFAYLNKPFSYTFALGIIAIIIASLFYNPINNLALILSLVLPIACLFLIQKSKLTPTFLLLQCLWFALAFFTILFNGDTTYVGVVEPVCWLIFIGSTGSLLKKFMQEMMEFQEKSRQKKHKPLSSIF